MVKDPFKHPVFNEADEARRALEALRWAGHPTCPRCAQVDTVVALKADAGQKYRDGLYYCRACRRQFTVTVGTMFEHARAPLHKWWRAAQMLNSGAENIDVADLHRGAAVTYKTARRMLQVSIGVAEGYKGSRLGFGYPFKSSMKKRKRAAYDKGKRYVRVKNPLPKHSPVPKAEVLKGLSAQAINTMALLLGAKPSGM